VIETHVTEKENHEIEKGNETIATVTVAVVVENVVVGILPLLALLDVALHLNKACHLPILMILVLHRSNTEEWLVEVAVTVEVIAVAIIINSDLVLGLDLSLESTVVVILIVDGVKTNVAVVVLQDMVVHSVAVTIVNILMLATVVVVTWLLPYLKHQLYLL
jgi:hypothetical protein